jgi:hypothetical protein
MYELSDHGQKAQTGELEYGCKRWLFGQSHPARTIALAEQLIQSVKIKMIVTLAYDRKS